MKEAESFALNRFTLLNVHAAFSEDPIDDSNDEGRVVLVHIPDLQPFADVNKRSERPIRYVRRALHIAF